MLCIRPTKIDRALALVAVGVGLALFPAHFEMPAIKQVLVSDLGLSRTIGLLWAREREGDLKEFIKFAGSHSWTLWKRPEGVVEPSICRGDAHGVRIKQVHRLLSNKGIDIDAAPRPYGGTPRRHQRGQGLDRFRRRQRALALGSAVVKHGSQKANR